MSIELYYHPQSPPSCIVWMVLKELEIDHKETVIDFYTNEQRSEAYAKINPRKQVPALRDGDIVLTESRAIAIYLCSKYEKADKKNKLYPRDILEQAKFHEIMMRDVDNYQLFYKYMNCDDVFEGKSQCMNDALLPRCEGILQEYDDMLATKEYIFGSALTFLDFACVQTVTFMKMSGYKNWEKYSNLKRWMNTLSQLPYFEECVDNPAAANVNIFQLLLEKGVEAYAVLAAQRQKS